MGGNELAGAEIAWLAELGTLIHAIPLALVSVSTANVHRLALFNTTRTLSVFVRNELAGTAFTAVGKTLDFSIIFRLVRKSASGVYRGTPFNAARRIS